MQLKIESTGDVVDIFGVECRAWDVVEINGELPIAKGGKVFTRMLVIDAGITDDHVFNIDDPRGMSGIVSIEEYMRTLEDFT